MKNFWSQIWNAEWLADTGLPLLVSLIALYVAYRFLKAQFKHDRALIIEQFAHDRRLVIEERRRAYAQRYVIDARRGLAELAVSESTYRRDIANETAFPAIFTRANDVFGRLLRSAEDLQIALGRSDLTDAAKTLAMFHILRISVYATAPELTSNGPSAHVCQSMAVRVMDDQWTAHLRDIAAALDTWDGSDPLPSLNGSIAQLELMPEAPADASYDAYNAYIEEFRQWYETQRANFESEVQTYAQSTSPPD